MRNIYPFDLYTLNRFIALYLYDYRLGITDYSPNTPILSSLGRSLTPCQCDTCASMHIVLVVVARSWSFMPNTSTLSNLLATGNKAPT